MRRGFFLASNVVLLLDASMYFLPKFDADQALRLLMQTPTVMIAIRPSMCGLQNKRLRPQMVEFGFDHSGFGTSS